MGSNSARLFQALRDKLEKYEAIVAKLGIAYVVAVFGEFTASIDDHELRSVLLAEHGGGVFAQSRNLSGVLFFEESNGQYKFEYFDNPKAQISMRVSSGIF
jgi:hypothetical protein